MGAGLACAALAAVIGAVVLRGPTAAEGTNLRLGDAQDLARARDGVGIAVNPADREHVVLVDSDLLRGLCQAHVSRDAGLTWTTTTLTAPERFPDPCRGLDSGGYHHNDGSVVFDGDDVVYTTFSARPETGGDEVLVARSDDGGETFAEAVVAIEPAAGAWTQRPRVAVDGEDVAVIAYQCRPTDGPCVDLVAASSPDGGATWTQPTAVNTDDIALEVSQPVMLDGEAHVAYRRRETLADEAGDRMVVRRLEGGEGAPDDATWEVVGNLDVPGVRQPKLAVGPDGGLYAVYHASASPAGDTDFDIRVVRSDDGGETWTPQATVNDDIGTGNQRLGSIAVAPGGRVDVVWFDDRDAPPAGEFLDVYYAASFDGGETFTENRRVTERSIRRTIGLDNEVMTYDLYPPVVAAVGDEVLVAWIDSREGTPDTDTQDVFLARLEPPAP